MADTIMLTDHEAIRSWAAARAGFPAIVDVSPETGTQAMLRLVFGQHAYQDLDEAERPVNAGGYELVEWDEWFKLFDERQLALVPFHSDVDWLISSHSRMGSRCGGTRISMLLGTRGCRRMRPLRSRVTII